MDLSLFQGELTIVIVQEHEVSSLVMGYHEYCKTCQMEPDNVVDKYAVAVINKSKVVGHLMNGKSGKFAKTVFFFLRAATVEITGKPNNDGKGMGIQVPCRIKFTGRKAVLDKLKDILKQL